MSESNFVEVVDCGVDWITCTCSDSLFAQRLVDRAALWIQDEKHQGNEQLVWSQYGYEGFTCGQVTVGQRHDGVIVRLSGLAAWSHWRQAAELATNVSRIDVQITIRYKRDAAKQISNHYKTAMRSKKRGDIKRAVSLYRSDDGSATLYLGKRSSDKFCRIYEKGIESKLDHYHESVRYEVEFKNKVAMECALYLRNAKDEYRACQSIVAGYLDDCRISSPGLGDFPLTLIRAPTERGTTQISLQWLESQVRPVVERMLECGKHSEVVEALGYRTLVQLLRAYQRTSKRKRR